MFFIILFMAVATLVGQILACPIFVEVFPNPTDVPDSQGEFVEIRLDSADLGKFHGKDSLKVQLDAKAPLVFPFPQTERVLLTHAGYACDSSATLTCGSLGSLSIPNSRETTWKLWTKDCRDSVHLSIPKAGKSFQRVKYSDEWVPADATPGMASPLYELDLNDCSVSGLTAKEVGADRALWNLMFHFAGCDSAWFNYRVENLVTGRVLRDSARVGESFSLNSVEGESFRIQATVPADESPANNVLDTMIFVPGKSPLVLSEIHHCPQEPEPEWVEVLNRGTLAFPLAAVRFCGRGNAWMDSLEGGASLVMTKDTATLRNFLGFRDVRMKQVSMGFLNNTAGSLSICYGDLVLDSVNWNKKTVKCPLGFSPLTGSAENTPGYQGLRSKKAADRIFTFKIPSRVVRKNKGALLVYLESSETVTLKLLDSSGRSVWKRTIPANSNAWLKVPADTLLTVGVGYLALSSGKENETVGILVRP